MECARKGGICKSTDVLSHVFLRLNAVLPAV